MTTPEHTLVGIHAAFALGIHSRLGWTAIALAAIASNVPDLDGLPMLFDMERFESGHRVWGHNLFAIAISSGLLAWSQYRWHWIERLASRFDQLLPEESRSKSRTETVVNSIGSLFVIGFIAQAIHLPCDMVVSGGNGLSDWLVFPFWPVSDWGFVLPLIPWGDVGPTVILMVGVIAIAKNPNRKQRYACLSLLLLVLYLVLRGISRGTLEFPSTV